LLFKGGCIAVRFAGWVHKILLLLCLWDSRYTKKHYTTKKWPERRTYVVWERNVKYSPLVELNKLILPRLHIKLHLMKNFEKALGKKDPAFSHFKEKFCKWSKAEWRHICWSSNKVREFAAWSSFTAVVNEFLGNKREAKYVSTVRELLDNYKDMGSRM
jgi:hypothetical protein